MALKTGEKYLKENWFVVSKMTRIWWILIGALKSPKNLHFDMPFPVMFDLKKSSGVIFHDTREWCKILKENWLLLSKMTWRIWEIFTRALESLKIGTLMGFFCPKLKMHELKIYWGVAPWEWRIVQKLKRNWLLNLTTFDSSTQKSQKYAL